MSDKRGLVPFAQALRSMDVELISTGGTLKALTEAGIEARAVSDVTGFPEILDGRVKTLHPKIHGALLAVDDNDQHLRELDDHGIEPIDMVVVNLYPFERTIARAGVTLDEALDQIDIGGPTLVRAAAKNFKHKVVVVNPDRYDAIVTEMRANFCEVSEPTCLALAREAFRHIVAYDSAIAQYFDRLGHDVTPFPEVFHLALHRDLELRYGENPHQRGVLYGNFSSMFEKLHGKELSYNNILDATAAARLVAEFEEPTVAIIKHTNPCGVGSAASLAEAYAKAFATDTKSAFGGIVAVNRELDMEAAEMMNEIFTEMIIAPSFAPGVVEFLQKKRDRRVMRCHASARMLYGCDVRSVPGGLLVQDADDRSADIQKAKVVTKRKPTADELRAMQFAWR
ncbi:MAG TPA: bifunctional phosphoribosylaminoimidazolecarboxamide formyltransferase/IMP cyclohydrolase, partial [Bacteroidota bacterium]|nr:bifunctional phosphoribosylaminoimidazolecarboxamide formyltransferase/IMP cyclohydrolase [Bacteroidota bacterium]